MELWDAYTKEEQLTGETLVRGEEIPKGRYHLVCEVLVRHVDGSYLCMKRSVEKPNYGGWYEATAGGSALAGEDKLRCVERELKEETGIQGKNFQEIGRFLVEKNHAIFYSFLCTVDCDKASVQLQEGETEDYRWMSEEEFIEFVNSEEMLPSNRLRYATYFEQMGYVKEVAMQKRYQYHFTPKKGWMNDPNGLVYIDGTYHLFYQHYPDDIVWGPMHWGHAVSTDLVHWEHKPIAIFPEEEEYIFSGSCVFDRENVSGLGTKEQPPLIALYTGHNPVTGEEQQCVAYSTDFEKFEKYEHNPVVANSQADPTTFRDDFRDPKVFPNPVKGGFSFVVAAGPDLEFYHSMDLLHWEKTGEFAPGIRGLSGICECPDCFPVKTEQGTRWILTMSMILPQEKVGKSLIERGFYDERVMQYFVGEFNGDTFVDTECTETPLVLEYGPDNYAMVSFLHTEEPLLLGWGENWCYVNKCPAEEYRGKMTMARRAALVDTERGPRLKFEPVTVDLSRKGSLVPTGEVLPAAVQQLTLSAGEQFVISGEGKKELCLKVSETEVCVERTLPELFGRKKTVMRAERLLQGDCRICIIKDMDYYEIFAEDGLLAFSVNL